MKRIKKNTKQLKHVSMDFSLKSIKENDSEITIRGLANANVVDRGKEKIATDAWQLDNFKKNPVILLNHGFDIMGGLPIGKATAIKPTENGLEIEAQISKSNNGAIPMIRDLITDGYLSTFSVGFDLIEGKDMEEDGKSFFLITKAELFEVSVVGVPMNQDSTFNVTQKDLSSLSKTQIEAKLLRQKNCHIQANIMDMLSEQTDTLDDFIKSMVRRTKMTKDELHNIMVGKSAVTGLFLKKAEAFLDCSPLELQQGNQDLEFLQAAIKRIEDGADPKESIKELHAVWHKAHNPCHEDDKKDSHTEEDDAEEDKAIKFATGETEDHTHSYSAGDKATGESNGHTHAIAEDGSIGEADGHTHAADPTAKGEDAASTEDDSTDDSSEGNAESDKLKDFQECVNGKIPTLMDEGMEQDQAVAAAIESCASEKSCDIGAFKNSAYAKCFEAAKAYGEVGEWSDVDLSEIKQALAEGETGDTTPIDTEQLEKDGITDPHLMAAQQTNVLLGTMINKFDSLLSAMAQQLALDNTEEDAEEDAEEDTATDEEKEKSKKLALRKRIALARMKQLQLQERVNALSIG